MALGFIGYGLKTEACSEPSQTSKIELFAETVKKIIPLAIFPKHSLYCNIY